MVTAKTQYNLKNAEQYFEEHLCVGDYYNEGQRVSGEWMGAGAERLGFSGKVRAEAGFEDVCVRPKDASREFIRSWTPGRNAADYVISATIEAVKPAAACCAPGCCA